MGKYELEQRETWTKVHYGVTERFSVRMPTHVFEWLCDEISAPVQSNYRNALGAAKQLRSEKETLKARIAELEADKQEIHEHYDALQRQTAIAIKELKAELNEANALITELTLSGPDTPKTKSYPIGFFIVGTEEDYPDEFANGFLYMVESAVDPLYSTKTLAEALERIEADADGREYTINKMTLEAFTLDGTDTPTAPVNLSADDDMQDMVVQPLDTLPCGHMQDGTCGADCDGSECYTPLEWCNGCQEFRADTYFIPDTSGGESIYTVCPICDAQPRQRKNGSEA